MIANSILALFVAGAASPPATDEATGVPRILVLDLEAIDGVSKGEVTLLRDAIVARIGRFPGVEVISSAEMTRLVELEATKALAGCDTTSTSCLAEIAGALGAQYLVSGSVGRLGDRVVLNLTLLEGAKAQSRGRTSIDGSSADELLRKLDAVDEIISPIARRTTASDGSPVMWTGAGVAGLGAVAVTIGGVWAGALEATLANTTGDPVAKGVALKQRGLALGTLAGGVVLAGAGGALVAWSFWE